MADLTSPPTSSRRLRKRTGIGVALIGLLVFLLGAQPELFGLARNPIVGFIQIAVFLSGLGLIALGGYLAMESMWRDRPKPVVTELGARLVGTGYVIALASGMADVFGLGTRPLPSVPFFGYWQGFGVLIGQVVMIIGFVMMSPFWAEVDLRKVLARLSKKKNKKKKGRK
ncbi:MAG: hypothetical protein WD740_03245 [Anaerolineales bacterium]